MAQRRQGWVWVSMVLVLLFASYVYLYQLNAQSYWEDESWMTIAIRGNLVDLWRFATEKGLHPPLYFYLAWVFARLAGDGEVALRWLGGLVGLIGIAFTYRLGTDWFNRRTGVYAALMTSGSLFLLYFARNARHYTLFFTLAVMLVWAYEHWQRDTRNRRWLAAIILLQTALLYTHYFGAWMAVVLGLHGLLFLRRRDWLRLIGGLILSGLLFLPWIPSLITQYSGVQSGLGYAVFDAGGAFRSYVDTMMNATLRLPIPGIDLPGLGVVLLVLGLVALIRQRQWRIGLLIIGWLALPTGLSLALNERYPLFVQRNLLFTLGAAMILFGAGLSWIASFRPGRAIATAAVMLFAFIGGYYYTDFWNFFTPNWREAAQQIAVDAHPDDLFVLRGELYSLDHYLERDLGQPVEIIHFREWIKHPETRDRTWLIDGNMAVRFEAIEALDSGMILTRRPVVLPIVAELYQRPPAEALTVFGKDDDRIALATTSTETALNAQPGHDLSVQLWWQRVTPINADYSVGVYLTAPDGTLIVQQDGGFDQGRVDGRALPTDTWLPDERTLSLPDDLPPGDYTLLVGVYNWRDGSRLTPENGQADDLYPFTTVRIE